MESDPENINKKLESGLRERDICVCSTVLLLMVMVGIFIVLRTISLKHPKYGVNPISIVYPSSTHEIKAAKAIANWNISCPYETVMWRIHGHMSILLLAYHTKMSI